MRTFRTLACLAVVVSLGFLAGCNTVEGVGEDIERGGEKLQNAAK